MAVEYRLVEINLGGNRTGVVSLPLDVVNYFKMPVSTAAAAARTRRRRAHNRRIYKDLNDATGDVIKVPEATWTDTPKPPKRGAGKLIRVPTALKNDKGVIRMVGMNFPSLAVTGAISEFLYSKCTANRPTFFLTAAGERHLVLNITGDVNPTPVPAPTPTPTPTPDTTP